MTRQELIKEIDDLIAKCDKPDINVRMENGLNFASVVLLALKGSIQDISEELLADLVHSKFILPRLNENRLTDNN